MATLKLRIVRGFCVAAGRDVFPGEVVEIAEAEARLRIAQGKATPVEKAATVEDEPEEASGADTETAGPAIKTTKGKGR
jgi:hypothetical protein